MNTDSIFSIAYLLIGIGFIFALLIIVCLFIAGFISSGIYESNYKKSVINIIKSNPSKKDTELVDCIKNEYTNYRKSKITAFSYFDIDTINSKLISDLRSDNYKKYYKERIKNNDIANKLERVNKIIKDELNFKEDDINEIVKSIQSLSVAKTDENEINELANKIKIKFLSCISFCNGRIYEKDIDIYNLNNKIKRGKIGNFFSWVGWIIGIISGIVTIYIWIKGM